MQNKEKADDAYKGVVGSCDAAESTHGPPGLVLFEMTRLIHRAYLWMGLFFYHGIKICMCADNSHMRGMEVT